MVSASLRQNRFAAVERNSHSYPHPDNPGLIETLDGYYDWADRRLFLVDGSPEPETPTRWRALHAPVGIPIRYLPPGYGRCLTVRSSRFARREARRYFFALNALPVPAITMDHRGPNGLPVLATETIGERRLQLSAIPGRPRLRVTFVDAEPLVLGSVIGLDGDRPEIRVSTPLHMDWAASHSAAITSAAARVWSDRQRHFGG